MTAIFQDKCGIFEVKEIRSIVHTNDAEWIVYFLDDTEEQYEKVNLLEIF